MDSANNNKQAAMSFFDELKRRNVYRVGVAYVIAGAAAHQEATRCLTRNVIRCGEIDNFIRPVFRALKIPHSREMTLPGFRIFFGSIIFFSDFINSISSAVRLIERYGFFSSPIPCSAEIAPSNGIRES